MPNCTDKKINIERIVECLKLNMISLIYRYYLKLYTP